MTTKFCGSSLHQSVTVTSKTFRKWTAAHRTCPSDGWCQSSYLHVQAPCSPERWMRHDPTLWKVRTESKKSGVDYSYWKLKNVVDYNYWKMCENVRSPMALIRHDSATRQSHWRTLQIVESRCSALRSWWRRPGSLEWQKSSAGSCLAIGPYWTHVQRWSLSSQTMKSESHDQESLEACCILHDL